MRLSEIPEGAAVSIDGSPVYQFAGLTDYGHDRSVQVDLLPFEYDPGAEAVPPRYVDYAASVTFRQGTFYVAKPSWSGWASD
jgi:hypothetical protein